MFDKAHKAQDNISITYKSSEPFTPSVNYDFSTLDKVKYKILEDFVKHPQRAYYPKDKDEIFAWVDGWTAKMTKEVMQ